MKMVFETKLGVGIGFRKRFGFRVLGWEDLGFGLGRFGLGRLLLGIGLRIESLGLGCFYVLSCRLIELCLFDLQAFTKQW